MISAQRDQLASFREKAAMQGFSPDDVERWAAIVRPCVRLTQDGDGPVVGRFGGPVLLPSDVPDPKHPFVASIDLAALPTEATGLPLPPDGELLLFAFPEEGPIYANVGSAVYVPVGTAVSERDKHFSWYSREGGAREMVEKYPQGPLRAITDLSLPLYCDDDDLEEDMWNDQAGWPPYSPGLLELLRGVAKDIDMWGTLQIGGHAGQEVHDLEDPLEVLVQEARDAVQAGVRTEPVSEDPEDWVLLADWHTGIEGWEGATVHWAMQRDDLTARRFDRVFADRYWNP
jgi:hypothetical protein